MHPHWHLASKSYLVLLLSVSTNNQHSSFYGNARISSLHNTYAQGRNGSTANKTQYLCCQLLTRSSLTVCFVRSRSSCTASSIACLMLLSFSFPHSNDTNFTFIFPRHIEATWKKKYSGQGMHSAVGRLLLYLGLRLGALLTNLHQIKFTLGFKRKVNHISEI